MFWPVEMKQLQNISVDVNVMPPNTDFARLGLGSVTPLVLIKYNIIITNTKPGPQSFPAMINLPRFCWTPAVSSGPPRARIGPGDRWDRGPLNVSDDWKQWRFETIFYTHYCNMILYHTNGIY